MLAVMPWNERQWTKQAEGLACFLEPMVGTLGRKERGIGATRYVQGLLMPGERKSIEPMAARLGVDPQGLQQFMSDSPWEAEELWRAIRREVIPSLGALEAWIVDETGWIKQGHHSVGVSHQYCGSVGKQANCQVCVEVVVSDGEIAAPAAGRLYLPQSWTEDRSRCRTAGVADTVKFATKPEIALELLRTVVSDGVEPAPVLADKVYGDCYEFRAGLRELGLEYCVQITASALKAWVEPPAVVTKFRRRYVEAGTEPALTLGEIAGQITPAQWRRASWKAADGSTRSTRLAWLKVWLAHGLRRTNGNLEPAWFLVDWPEGEAEPYHSFIAHFHREPTKARCLRASRSRWHVEQYFQREKTDLGLDHYEGRSWRGFHHHLVLSAVAYLFVTSCHLRAKKNFWPDVGTGLASNPAVVAEINRVLSLLRQQV